MFQLLRRYVTATFCWNAVKSRPIGLVRSFENPICAPSPIDRFHPVPRNHENQIDAYGLYGRVLSSSGPFCITPMNGADLIETCDAPMSHGVDHVKKTGMPTSCFVIVGSVLRSPKSAIDAT